MYHWVTIVTRKGCWTHTGPPTYLWLMYLGFPGPHIWWALRIQKLQSLFIVIMNLQREEEKKIKGEEESLLSWSCILQSSEKIFIFYTTVFSQRPLDLWALHCVLIYIFGQKYLIWYSTCILILAISESLRESKIDFSSKHSWAWP